MIAQAATIPTLTPQRPTGFVYNVCRRTTVLQSTCPPLPPGVNTYAGPRLALQQGDTLKVHFINKLPPLLDSKHAMNPDEPNHQYLSMNPTNIHTHGLLVSGHYPQGTDTTYGDNIFVLTFNSANVPQNTNIAQTFAQAAVHADVRMDSTDYLYQIPTNHPSGLFWIHPHVHGIALNQISSGLAGMITIGSVSDYVCNNASCAGFASQLNIRHMLIKEMEVLANGYRMDQPDTTMCLSPDTGGLVLPALQGYCAGQDFSGSASPDADGTPLLPGTAPNYTGAKWFFTVNGQVYPTITAKAQGGEIWRMVNASGSVTQNLVLFNPATQSNMIFQVLSIDGVSVDSNSGAYGSGMFTGVACPGLVPKGTTPTTSCTDRLLMMPSSRVEIWVAYRDASGTVVTPPPGATAIFRTEGFNTGPAGDTWPAVDLAQVNFTGTGPLNPPRALVTSAPPASLSNPLAYTQDVGQTDNSITGPNDGVVPGNCTPLPTGHHRRVYFNVPADHAELFGLGYEEIDQNGTPVPNTFVDVTEFNAATPTVCLQLGPNNTAVSETWELVNLSGEDHNFHIHQTKFSVQSFPAGMLQANTSVPTTFQGSPLMLDNIPVLHANGTTDSTNQYYNPTSPGGCASVADYKSGACSAPMTVINIPFYVAGDYVYHCHILEHEDGGMMSRIRVLPHIN